MANGQEASLKVVEKVAEEKGIDPLELKPPLHSVVDTEALDSLFRSTPTATSKNGIIEFRYCDYLIQVNSSGDVKIVDTVTAT